jgi:hypothetical protein
MTVRGIMHRPVGPVEQVTHASLAGEGERQNKEYPGCFLYEIHVAFPCPYFYHNLITFVMRHTIDPTFP